MLRMSTTATEWLAAFAAQLGVDAPGDDECSDIRSLAGTVAHDSERLAAPIACWMAAKSELQASATRESALGLVVPESESHANDVE